MTHDDMERDEALGRALRQSLEPRGSVDQFTTRLFQRVERSRVRAWDLLASWSRWGLAAAAVVLTVVAVAWLHPADRDSSLDAALATSDNGEVTRIIQNDDPPGHEALFVYAGDED